MRSIVRLLVLFIAAGTLGTTCSPAQSTASVAPAAEAGKVIPATVFFKGKSAPVQARNSGGVKVGDAWMLAALVDTSGYATSVQERYQAYLITEMPLQIEGHHLDAGAYGVGFIAGHTFVVMDVGGHDLFTVDDEQDAKLARPTPLKVAAGDGGGYKLYAGRTFVKFTLESAGAAK